jgi:seryl-tRNA synthetase
MAFLAGCSQSTNISSSENGFNEPKSLNVKKMDIYNEMLHINDRLVNSDKRVEVLNEKVNTLAKRKDKSEEIDSKLKEHEKVLMALMNDVVDLSKSQKNLQVSNRMLHEDIEQVKIKLESFVPTTFEISRKSNIRIGPWKKIVHVWERGKRFTAFNAHKDWVKISGIFIDDKWTKLNKELWIHKSNIKRFR